MKNIEQKRQTIEELKTKYINEVTGLLKTTLTKRQSKISDKILEYFKNSNYNVEDLYKYAINKPNSTFEPGHSIARVIASVEKTVLNRGKVNIVPISYGKIKNLATETGPKHDKVRFIGIEIECIIPMSGNNYCDDCDSDDCSHVESNVNDAYDSLRLKFENSKLLDITVKSDGSIADCNDDEIGAEITFTCSINNLEKIEKVCNVLNKYGARVNKTCGLHVHLDMRQYNPKIHGQRLVDALPVLTRLVPSTRRENSYCRPNNGKLIHNSCRYMAINYQAYSTHRTIEVRLHSSTTNGLKIINWVKLLNAITMSTEMDTLSHKKTAQLISDDFFLKIGFNDSELRRYFLQREALFMNNRIEVEQRSLEESAA